MEFSFEKLIAWQKAMELVRMVYAVAKTFPMEERYALTDQLRRAVISIPSNIAEGYGRAGNKDYAHFLAIARGSLYETITQIRIAQQLGYLDKCDQLESLANEVGSIIGTLLKKYGAIHPSPSPLAFA